MKISILFLFVYGFINAQIISGKVLNEETQEPIPYIKIGVEDGDLATVSDENGMYNIDLSNVSKNKNIIAEYAGYHTFKQNISDFISNKNGMVLLKEKVTQIPEVILSKKYLYENWGINSKSESTSIGGEYTSEKEGFYKEWGIFIKNKKKVKIEKFNLNILDFSQDKEFVIAFNVYNVKDGKPNENILQEPVIVKVTKDDVENKKISIDVKDKNIWINKESFFITTQVLTNAKYFLVSGALLKTCYIRTNYDKWIKLPMMAAPSINIDVKIEQ